MRKTAPNFCFIFLASALLGKLLSAELPAAEAVPKTSFDLQAELERSLSGPLRRVPPAVRHLPSLSTNQVQARAAQARTQSQLLQEKSEDKWFAAFVPVNGPEPLAIGRRFSTWGELSDFVQTNQALVEVWSDPGGGATLGEARRITAHEMAAFRKQEAEPPTLITITCRDPVNGLVRSNKVEFAFNAAERVLPALQQAARTQSQRSTNELAAQAILAAWHLDGAGTGAPQLERSAQLDQAVREGGVVEQIMPAESGTFLSPERIEPEVHLGPKALEERYTQVLGNLLEWRHHLQKKALGLPMNSADLLQAASVLEDLASKDIWIDDGDALLTADNLNSSFTYRRYIRGQPRLVTVTGILPRADLVRDVAKAEVSRRIELQQRTALSSKGNGIALVHRVQEVNGRPEVGPLVFSEDHAEGIDSLFALLDRLPVTDRARIRFERFSRTMIDADLDGRGGHDRFFLTLQFPAGKTIQRQRINPLTGERELLVEENGLLIKTLTDLRITEIDYNSDREETATRTYANTGSIQTPAKGALLEESRAVETWQRDLSQPNVDPALPTLSKSQVNHVTGESTHEIYGLFPQPLATVDDQFITYRQFNRYGIFVSAAVFENGRVPQDFARPLLTKLNDPVVGRQRFQLSSTLPQEELPVLRTLKAQNYLTTLLRRDLVRSSTQTQVFDNGHWGRKIRELSTDRLEAQTDLPLTTSLEYSPNFFSGQIPTKATVRSPASGKLLSQIETKSYDPFLRQLGGVDLEYTGKVVTNLWDHRWTAPIEIQTVGRKTVQQFNWDETEISGATAVADSGEEVSRFFGRFDPASQHWQIQRMVWFRPAITNQSQALTLSSAGRVLSLRVADSLERRPAYGPDGIEQATFVYRKHPTSGQFNLLQQQEDSYRWNAGERTARVQVSVEGHPYDQFQRVTDREARTIQDQIKELPGLSLKTLITYDGWSERPLKAETLQNGQLRSSRHWQAEERQANGSYLLPVQIVPSWGLTCTQAFLAGDVLARPVSSHFENGDSLQVEQWFEATDIPRSFELRDRHGRPRERFSRRLNAGTDRTFPYDLVEREKLSPWGGSTWVETKAFLRGTDFLLFAKTPGQVVHYDLAQPFEAPTDAVDLEAKAGVQILTGGQKTEHVLTLLRATLATRPEPARGQRGAESILSVDSIALHDGTVPEAVRRTFDRAGNLLDERIATLPPGSSNLNNAEALFAALTRASSTERFHYRYQPGWVFESDGGGHGRAWTYSAQRPDSSKASFAVNTGPHREWVTEIEGIKSAAGSSQSSLKNYFFRRLHRPRQIELNSFLPGCSNVWTSWMAADLSPEGITLFNSELVYDAQGRLSVRKTTKSNGRGAPQISVAYQLPDPDPRTWKTLRLTGGTNSFALDLAGTKMLGECDFLYFYLQNTNRAPWTAILQSASGQDVQVSPTTESGKKGAISTSALASFNAGAWADKASPASGTLVLAPQRSSARESIVLISVTNLVRAGFNGNRLASATLEIAGTVGDVVRLSTVAPLVREIPHPPSLDKRKPDK